MFAVIKGCSPPRESRGEGVKEMSSMEEVYT